MTPSPTTRAPSPDRRRTGDPDANLERIITAALDVIARHGVNVPLGVIADTAGVGIGTFYRRFPDRSSLLEELAVRSYADLDAILNEVLAEESSGLDAVRRFLQRSVAIGDGLVLPLRGAPPVRSDSARRARNQIALKLEALLDRGRQDGSVTSAVNAMDIAVTSAILTQPGARPPDWDAICARHIGVYVAGLGQAVTDLPAPPTRFDQD